MQNLYFVVDWLWRSSHRTAAHVAIFDDRIEIWSPGELPQGMTLEKLNQPHKSVLRNGTIAELLYLVRYIEKWGTGIQNINDWMTDYKLPKPEVILFTVPISS